MVHVMWVAVNENVLFFKAHMTVKQTCDSCNNVEVRWISAYLQSDQQKFMRLTTSASGVLISQTDIIRVNWESF